MSKQNLPRVFIDASVLVSGILSHTGASRVILDLGKEGIIALVMTEEVVREARLSIKKKYLESKSELQMLFTILSEQKSSIQTTPSMQEIKKFDSLIDDHDDRHVLAGAEKYKAEILVTLDKKHFFTQELKATILPFKIQLPGEFLNNYRTINKNQG